MAAVPCNEMSIPEPTVEHEVADQRFVVRCGDLVAELDYWREGDDLVLAHTWVPVGMRNQGIAARLVVAAARYCEEESLGAVAACPYVRAWFKKNPERFPQLTVK